MFWRIDVLRNLRGLTLLGSCSHRKSFVKKGVAKNFGKLLDFSPASLLKRNTNAGTPIFSRTPILLKTACDSIVYRSTETKSWRECWKGKNTLLRRISTELLSLQLTVIVIRRSSIIYIFWKILKNSQENACARASFSIKLQALGLQLY